MLRFNRQTEVSTEAEFEIISAIDQPKESKPHTPRKRKLTKRKSLLKKPLVEAVALKPAWTDDGDTEPPGEEYRPPPILDVHKYKNKEPAEQGSASDKDDSDTEYAVHCTTKILREEKSPFLPETKSIGIQRLFDANRERISLGSLSSVHFNPAYQIVLTASEDSTLALFKVDGKENALLRDRVFEKFPLSSAKFTSKGDRIVMTSNRNSFRLYDLETGVETRASPFIGSATEEILNRCELSAGQANLVALQSNGNKVYLADLRSLERIATLQTRDLVRSCCFVEGGSFMDTIDASGGVYVFDLRTRRPRMIHQWSDEASTGGAVIASSPDGEWIACGSDSGFVNVYSLSNTVRSPHPHPDKSIANLRSRADLATFHPGNEILCIGSTDQSAAVRLYHLRSRQVFENFPVRVGRLGLASAVAFSPGGKYLCVGQRTGRAALYSIAHYPDY